MVSSPCLPRERRTPVRHRALLHAELVLGAPGKTILSKTKSLPRSAPHLLPTPYFVPTARRRKKRVLPPETSMKALGTAIS